MEREVICLPGLPGQPLLCVPVTYARPSRRTEATFLDDELFWESDQTLEALRAASDVSCLLCDEAEMEED